MRIRIRQCGPRGYPHRSHPLGEISAQREALHREVNVEGPGLGLVNNTIRISRLLRRSTPSVKVSVRTRNPPSDYHFHTIGSTIHIVDNCSRRTGPR